MVISENGNLPEKEGHIEIYDCASYLLWVRTQPSMVLHELCHALHFRRRDAVDSLIEECFEEASQSGKYDSVWYWHNTLT